MYERPLTPATPPLRPDPIWGHPLELFPWFRRFPPSPLRDIVYTFLWNSMLATGLTMLSVGLDPGPPIWPRFRTIFVLSQCIGYVIHLEFKIGDWITGCRVHQLGLTGRAIYYSTLPVIGVFIGYWIGFWFLHMREAQLWLFSANGALSIVLLSVLLSSMILGIAIPRERAARNRVLYEQERARAASVEREAVLARLKLLEAQVEPHFLYNTLANVMSLVDTDPAVAKRMIDRLIAMLRTTASAATASEIPLATELAHVQAYLELMSLRAPRLRYGIDAPAECAQLAVAPLVLQPLVENAIRHGIEPLVEGGEVIVRARCDEDRLVLEVADDGAGIPATRPPPVAGSGLGLTNLRARLEAQYAGAASLAIEENAPRGTRVVIALPAKPFA